MRNINIYIFARWDHSSSSSCQRASVICHLFVAETGRGFELVSFELVAGIGGSAIRIVAALPATVVVSVSSLALSVLPLSAVAARARATKKAVPPTAPERPNRSPKKTNDKPAAQSGCDA